MNFNDTSGTPGYMAPEVMCNLNHGFTVDFFALGVIIFEMIIGKRPYNGNSRKEVKDKIIAAQAFLKSPIVNFSEDIISFTNLVLKINIYIIIHINLFMLLLFSFDFLLLAFEKENKRKDRQ